MSGDKGEWTHYDKRLSVKEDYYDPSEEMASVNERKKDNNKSARQPRRHKLAQKQPRTQNLVEDYDEEHSCHEGDDVQLDPNSHTKTNEVSVNNGGVVQ